MEGACMDISTHISDKKEVQVKKALSKNDTRELTGPPGPMSESSDRSPREQDPTTKKKPSQQPSSEA
ncbi:hypothetical protein RB195_012348 [Necator americanus]|uniref:Uncharacterized protein n=1 Tax=Necator americanus TaxID=51031 RepID=A0ABR1D7H3_NECAM